MNASGVIFSFNRSGTSFWDTYKTNRNFSTMVLSSRLLKFSLNSHLFARKVAQAYNSCARTITEGKCVSSSPNNEAGNLRLVVCSRKHVSLTYMNLVMFFHSSNKASAQSFSEKQVFRSE